LVSGDQALRNFFYELDYNTWKFNEKKFPGSKDEPILDKMLFVFDLLGRFAASGNIALGDLSIIAFDASRVLGRHATDARPAQRSTLISIVSLSGWPQVWKLDQRPYVVTNSIR
jgi:hypothetical protein